jgi:hypothetical protein
MKTAHVRTTGMAEEAPVPWQDKKFPAQILIAFDLTFM